MTLEQRARAASIAIEDTVAHLTPPALGARRRVPRRLFVYAPITVVFVALVAAVTVLFSTVPNGTAAPPPILGDQIATIPLGHQPAAVTAGQGSVYVASFDGHLLKVDPATNRVVGSVDLGSSGEMVLNGGSLWVETNTRENGVVTQVDARTLRVVRRVTVTALVTGLASDGPHVWVATAVGRLDEIDARTGRLARSSIVVSSQSAAHGLDFVVVEGDSLWVTAPQTGEVLRIDPVSGHVLKRIAIRHVPAWLTAVRGAVWVGSNDPPGLIRIDPASGEQAVFASPVSAPLTMNRAVALSGPSGPALWVIAGGGQYPQPSHWFLFELNAGTGAVVRSVPIDNAGVGPAQGPGALWLGLTGDEILLRYQLLAGRR